MLNKSFFFLDFNIFVVVTCVTQKNKKKAKMSGIRKQEKKKATLPSRKMKIKTKKRKNPFTKSELDELERQQKRVIREKNQTTVNAKRRIHNAKVEDNCRREYNREELLFQKKNLRPLFSGASFPPPTVPPVMIPLETTKVLSFLEYFNYPTQVNTNRFQEECY